MIGNEGVDKVIAKSYSDRIRPKSRRKGVEEVAEMVAENETQTIPVFLSQ